MADMANQSWHSFLLSPDSASGIITGAKSITFDNSCLKNCVEKHSTFTPGLRTTFLSSNHGNVNTAEGLKNYYKILTLVTILLLCLQKFLIF